MPHRILKSDRTIQILDSETIDITVLEALDYAQAKDGTWVYADDVARYESGQLRVREPLDTLRLTEIELNMVVDALADGVKDRGDWEDPKEVEIWRQLHHRLMAYLP